MEQQLQAGARPRRSPERVAALLRRVQGGAEPEALPREPELVTIWRQLVTYRDWLVAAISRWQDAGFALGKLPKEHLQQLRDELTMLDDQIEKGTRWKGSDQKRGHHLGDLRELAGVVERSERAETVRWIAMWLTAKSDHYLVRARRGGRDVDSTQVQLLEATVKARLGRGDVDELERQGRGLRGNDFGDLDSLAERIADLAHG